MLRTRHRLNLLFAACLESRAKLVLDNTNLTCEERAAYIGPARAAGFEVNGYFFRSRVAEALDRNRQRPFGERLADQAIHGASGRLALPSYAEGFNSLYFVRLDESLGFMVEGWNPETG